MTEESFVLESFSLQHPDGSTIGPWTFSLEAGRTGALCGPSGSGKTSLLLSLAGLDPVGFRPVVTSGHKHVTAPVDLLFEKPFLQVLGPLAKDELRAAEASSWLPSEERKQEREWLLEAFGLDSLWDRPVRELSEGERQKLALACLFLRSPALLLLDQPASSLDPRGQKALKAAVERITARGAAALVADPDWKAFTPEDVERFSLFPKASSLPLEVYADRLFDGPGLRQAGSGDTVLAFDGLEIRRGGRTVLRDISGKVSRGEIIALVGANGSGKTSLLLAVAGLLKPGRGKLTRPYRLERSLRRARPALMLQEALWHLSGKPVKAELAWAGRGHPFREGVDGRITAVIPAKAGIPKRLKPRDSRRSLPPQFSSGGGNDAGGESLHLSTPSRERGFLPDMLASLLDLEGLRDRPGLLLSRGEMQRVALAMAMLRNAPLVCLDEPFRFLWEQERKTIGRVFQAARNRGLSLLIASPVEEPLPWADQVWRLNRGRMEICRNRSACDNSATQSSLAPSGAQ